MQVRTKVKIVKHAGSSSARKITCAEDNTVLRSEPIDLPDATEIIKSLSLTQESKTELNGAVTYIYA